MKFLVFMLTILLTGCGFTPPKPTQKAVEVKDEKKIEIKKATSQMNGGDNEGAIETLEALVLDYPDDREVNVLLASAYAGHSGIDIVRATDAFEDILFDQSIFEKISPSLLKKNLNDKKQTETSEITPSLEPELDVSDDPSTQEANKRRKSSALVAESLRKFENAIDGLYKASLFLNRLPSVPEGRMDLLGQAVARLDEIKADSPLALYRLTLRVIYLKEYFWIHIVGDESFGSKSWFCSLDLENLYSASIFVARQLIRAMDDTKLAYKDREDFNFNSIDRVRALMVEAVSDIEEASKDLPPASRTTIRALEDRIKDATSCYSN